jgi:ubiquinone/menaquinone biosynthesis C-methylase UbiE
MAISKFWRAQRGKEEERISQQPVERARETWSARDVNAFDGPHLAIQTAYEQRYLRRSIEYIQRRLVHPRTRPALDIGAGYGRLSMVLAEYFSKSIAVEREQGLIDEAQKFWVDDVEFISVETLARLNYLDGTFALAFTCTVLSHMLDYDVPIVLREACRVARGGFVLLVEITEPGYLHGTYGVKKFTKGRTIDEYAAMMHPFELDFVRPRFMGGASGPVLGSFVMFRDPTLPPGSASINGLEWDLPRAPA